ncbi:MAG: DEAD/DEAH box helicase [Thermoprotei archaeon]|jgi:DEAD/DEAH box helicase domain-containing protein
MFDIIKELRLGKSLIYSWIEESKGPELGPFIDNIDIEESLKVALRIKGIDRLYEFQWRSMQLIEGGHDIVIVSGTGMGKTEAFLIPILNKVIRDSEPGVNALILYPTKALTADQLNRIQFYTSKSLGLDVGIYDGDTTESERRKLFTKPPKVLLSNPDMIHFSLSIPRFREIISNLRFVVFDEMHVYNGVFGAHVAYLVRRLTRLLGKVQFIGATATIDNPQSFASMLFNRSVSVVESYGRKSRLIHIMIKSDEVSRHIEVLRIVKNLINLGLKTLVFGDSHRTVEYLAFLSRKYNINVGVHRAGLPRVERRMVEHMLRTGELMAVIATPTLELGIDIGDLDAVVLDGIPPTYTKYIHRAGRCGRRDEGYVIMVLGEDPISSYYIRKPQEYYSQAPDELPLDLTNEDVQKHQILSASIDKPLREDDELFNKEIVNSLVNDNLLVKRGNSYYPTPNGKRVFYKTSIRGASDRVIIINENGQEIGDRELPIALGELHPEAVYFHGGRIYKVIELNMSSKPYRALVTQLPHDFGFYTLPLRSSFPVSFKPLDENTFLDGKILYGKIEIENSVYGYIIKRMITNEIIDERILENPINYRFKTKGLMLRLQGYNDWSDLMNGEAFHAIEHTLISSAQMIIGAGPGELGGISNPNGLIVIYDGAQGGSGLSKLLMKRFSLVFQRMSQIISACDCEDGCPRCVYSPYCGNNNHILSRKNALKVLEGLISKKLKVLEPLPSTFERMLV